MYETLQDPNFPQEGEVPAAGDGQQKRRGFSNPLYASDSLTSCTAFISEIKSHRQGEDTLYFARLGLIQGTEQNDGGEYKRKVGNNVDLLVGRSLRPWAAANLGEGLKSLTARVQIRNLEFYVAEGTDGKTYLNNRGILETAAFGHLDQ